MAHMVENVAAAQVQFSAAELAQFDAAASSIEIRGARLPDAVLAFSDVEAPPRR